MTDCETLRRCSFFRIKPNDHAQEIALAGFQRLYCKGDKKDHCMRRIVGTNLGPEFIPMNMMPNGHPLKNSDNSDWSEEVKSLIRDTERKSKI